MRNIDKSEAERVAGAVNMSDSGEPEKNFIIFGGSPDQWFDNIKVFSTPGPGPLSVCAVNLTLSGLPL